jgi:hypothetical protein
MARIQTGTAESIYKIEKWLGVNENPDGDTSLKMGEAAEMRNFRITADGHLQKRPGYKTIIDMGGAVQGLWTGFVNGNEHTLAASGGKIFLLDTEAHTKAEIGTCHESNAVHFFGYGKKLYILDGNEYYCWDGETYGAVEGYVPLVVTAAVPTGGGTQLEQVNKLTGKRRVRFSPDGTAKTFQLPETDLASIDSAKDIATGADMTGWTADIAKGTLTFTAAPAANTANLEVTYTAKATDRSKVTSMRFSETYNGQTDNRVFLYGDGSNELIYSGIDQNGMPTAEYFPDLNELRAGEENTPVTGAIKQYSRLIVFKTDSTYSVSYSSLTLVDGSVTAGFYILPVNRNIGNAAPGQVQLIANYPRSLHGGGVYEWKNGSYGLTNDERQAKRISARIESTLGSFDASKCITFDNEFKQDYYIVHNGTAVIHNYAEDAWFIYTDFPATAFTMIGNELYMATKNGGIAHVSREYMSDDGAAINAFWRSGSMSFGREWQRKVSTMIFVTIKPESAGRITVTARSDRKAEYSRKVIAASLATFGKVNFAHFSFNTNRRPQVERAKIKVKNFALYQLVFESNSASERSTVETVDFRLRYSGYVK